MVLMVAMGQSEQAAAASEASRRMVETMLSTEYLLTNLPVHPSRGRDEAGYATVRGEIEAEISSTLCKSCTMPGMRWLAASFMIEGTPALRPPFMRRRRMETQS